MRVIEVNMVRRQNGGAGETGDSRENPPTNGIVLWNGVSTYTRFLKYSIDLVRTACSVRRIAHWTHVQQFRGKNRAPFIELTPSLASKPSRGRRSLGIDCDGTTEEKRCCRYPLTIDFEQFEWDWIIAPKTYEANYCAGDCPYVFLQKYPHSYIIQVTNRTICCAPRKMSSISMLYFNAEHNILHSTLPGMTVEKCARSAAASGWKCGCFWQEVRLRLARSAASSSTSRLTTWEVLQVAGSSFLILLQTGHALVPYLIKSLSLIIRIHEYPILCNSWAAVLITWSHPVAFPLDEFCGQVRGGRVKWRDLGGHQHRGLETRAGEVGDPREDPPTGGIVRHDSYLLKSGSGLAGNRARWQASSLTTTPPRPLPYCAWNRPPVSQSVGAPPDLGSGRPWIPIPGKACVWVSGLNVSSTAGSLETMQVAEGGGIGEGLDHDLCLGPIPAVAWSDFQKPRKAENRMAGPGMRVQ
ncbi:hypothetical protein PR048_003695 [Dryococelus australis]|uniref:TGF-beta family profile domain-containing protein n=1 Tax=Dryococelus australis TaxID=614101 RepID=A0ABQ9INV1_9NEOP|nr:hypothetical protein PR048_003695 [Dryococelus australis]